VSTLYIAFQHLIKMKEV